MEDSREERIKKSAQAELKAFKEESQVETTDEVEDTDDDSAIESLKHEFNDALNEKQLELDDANAKLEESEKKYKLLQESADKMSERIDELQKSLDAKDTEEAPDEKGKGK
ncbi:MAG: hypothetical protein ACRCVT_03745 [Leadbetterella sp.]